MINVCSFNNCIDFYAFYHIIYYSSFKNVIIYYTQNKMNRIFSSQNIYPKWIKMNVYKKIYILYLIKDYWIFKDQKI